MKTSECAAVKSQMTGAAGNKNPIHFGLVMIRLWYPAVSCFVYLSPFSFSFLKKFDTPKTRWRLIRG